jgi:DNA sulfur modification protein DndC
MINYQSILFEIQQTYLADKVPWIIGFSGGKDSTTLLQMIFQALSQLSKEKLMKEIHVICNDTLVENPAIEEYIDTQLIEIEIAGKKRLFSHNPDLFNVVKVTPKFEDSFWVNLIGKGYPSPNRWFRWCTERLKINPTSSYIKNMSQKSGKAIIILGTRKAESANRAASMEKYDNGTKLKKHRLPNVYVYTPIADLSNNEVWAYLLQVKNPWGTNNRELLKLYGSACDMGECPLVIETGTQSCGKSRFGCWVCTVVDRDKSMENFVNNGHVWMKDLLDFRNLLYKIRQQSYQYVPKRIESKVKFGPFLIKTRRKLLKRLLNLQECLSLELIAPRELNYINELLQNESKDKTKQDMRKFIFDLQNGKRIIAISDFNILLSFRNRLGSIHLKNANLITSKKLSTNYLRSSRVMYYEV